MRTSARRRRRLDRGVEDALVSPWLGAVGQSAFYRQIAQADERHTDEVEPLYGRIAAPTLVVWGEEDRWLAVERGRELARRIPGARLELLPGAGHLAQEDEPEEVARVAAAQGGGESESIEPPTHAGYRRGRA